MIPITTQKNNERKQLERNIQELEKKEELTFAERIELKQLKTKRYHKYGKVE